MTETAIACAITSPQQKPSRSQPKGFLHAFTIATVWFSPAILWPTKCLDERSPHLPLRQRGLRTQSFGHGLYPYFRSAVLSRQQRITGDASFGWQACPTTPLSLVPARLRRPGGLSMASVTIWRVCSINGIRDPPSVSRFAGGLSEFLERLRSKRRGRQLPRHRENVGAAVFEYP